MSQTEAADHITAHRSGLAISYKTGKFIGGPVGGVAGSAVYVAGKGVWIVTKFVTPRLAAGAKAAVQYRNKK